MRQVQVWLDPELLERVDRKAVRRGVSRQAALVEALREWLGEVDDGGRAVGPGSGRFAAAERGGSRPDPFGDGGDSAVVGAAVVFDPLDGPWLHRASHDEMWIDPVEEIA